jgi:ribosomal protein S27AE
MKTCFKCNTVRPLTDFYAHLRMSDGHLNKCKQCTKIDVLEHRNKNIEKVRQYDRDRAKNPDRQKANIAITKAWRQEDKRRGQCHSAVSYAIKTGELVRKNCERCGNENSLAHHEDYDKPLMVNWLCQPCHKQRHKEINSK